MYICIHVDAAVFHHHHHHHHHDYTSITTIVTTTITSSTHPPIHPLYHRFSQVSELLQELGVGDPDGEGFRVLPKYPSADGKYLAPNAYICSQAIKAYGRINKGQGNMVLAMGVLPW
jgi:hypothetical protein